MYRKLMRNTTMALGTLLLGSSLVMAGGLQGTVSAIDSKGMATVRTSDQKGGIALSVLSLLLAAGLPAPRKSPKT